MSVRIMAAVFEMDLPNPGQKMVMLALADRADEDGVCWPAIGTIARKCSMSRRAVIYHLQALRKAGLLSVETVPGKGNLYRLHPCKICTGAKSAPVQNLHSTGAKSAPNTSGSIRVYELERARAKPAAAKEGDPLPDWVPPDSWAAFADMRQRMRAPLTPHARKLILRRLERLRSEGFEPAAVLDQSVERGWRGVFGISQEGGRSGTDRQGGRPPVGAGAVVAGIARYLSTLDAADSEDGARSLESDGGACT